ncbi:MAG TPA: hypothetical protein VMV05_10080, partial [bacterium]|nr:hypothetical protein [bacterium]
MIPKLPKTIAGKTVTSRAWLFALTFLAFSSFSQAQTYFGNQSVVSSSQSITLNSNSIRGSERFTARTSMAVGSIDLYFEASNSGPQYRVGVQGDSGGVPSGSYLSSPTTFSLYSSGGWQSISLTSSVNIYSGNVYHIVVEAVNASGYLYAIWRQAAVPGTQLYPQGQQVDPNMGIAQDLGNGWQSVAGYQPLFVLRDTGFVVRDGNPYAAQADQEIYGSNMMAERF